MNYNKILGYILLAIGLSIIIWSLFQSYNIFTAKISAPLLFKTQAFHQSSQNGAGQDLQKQLDAAIKQQIGQLLSADTITKILNLFSWTMLAGILILGGSQVAGLGIKLISK